MLGDSRFCVNWLAKTVPWSRLVARICEVTRTAETQAEYLAMPKSKQDEIKDIGGFVGGTLAGPRRVAKAVLTRTLLSLDGDYADRPIVGRLVAAGPAGLLDLAAEHGFTPRDFYADKCHLCWSVRRWLRSKGLHASQLGPDWMYQEPIGTL